MFISESELPIEGVAVYESDYEGNYVCDEVVFAEKR